RTEGIISAPETNHAIRATIDEALKCKETGESKVILMNHSGHGHFDMAAYEAYLSGKLTDYAYPEDMVKAALAGLPEVPAEYK
ncbi:TrpB-like pyridoxal-phosphate dependent enzyme, partial [Chloroflexota bacterium]